MDKKGNTIKQGREVSRRDFIKTTAALSLTALLPGASQVFGAAGSDELKVGLIGCGGRGIGAVTQILMSTDTPVKLWAMGDLFRDQLDKSYDMLSQGAEARYDRVSFSSLSKQMDVPEKRKFSGFDAYKKVLASGVDIVILATTPHYRPEHSKAPRGAGKQGFGNGTGKHRFPETPPQCQIGDKRFYPVTIAAGKFGQPTISRRNACLKTGFERTRQ